MKTFVIASAALVAVAILGCSKQDEDVTFDRRDVIPRELAANNAPPATAAPRVESTPPVTNRPAIPDPADATNRTGAAALPPAGDLGPNREGSRPQDEALTGTDAVIATRILVAVRGLDSNVVQAVRIQVVDGKVTLVGSVPTAEQRDSIGKLAEGSEGVRSVQNDIEIEPNPVP